MSADDFEALWDQAESGDLQAQLALGRAYRDRQEFGRARRWFGRAARAGCAEAWTDLGRLELLGLGQAADPAAAYQHFRAAVEGGDREGRYQLALMTLRRGQTEEALDHLLQAAHAGLPAAVRELGHLWARSDLQAALPLWQAAAHAGDRMAQAALALALHRGDGTRSDPDAARRWAAAARANGSYCRARFEPIGSEASDPLPPPPDFDFNAIRLPPPMADESISVQHPAGDERIAVFENIVSAHECEYLMETAAPHLLPSYTVHPHTGDRVRNQMRTSYGCGLHPTEEDFVILAIKRRLAAQTGLPLSHAEPFSLLRYEPGQEYKSHFDYIDPASGEAGREIERNGQRHTTVFAYLTDVAEGGETEFCTRDVRVAPQQGRALMFRNIHADGSPDADSLHASLPVRAGEKWIATLWLRDREFHP